MNAGLRVIARRWDGLGGRLNAIANAFSLARAFDAEFRFAWPPSRDLSVGDASEIFNPDFLARHLASIDELEQARAVPVTPASPVTWPDSAQSLEPGDWKGVPAIAGESTTQTARRFRADFTMIGWNDTAANLVERALTGDHAKSFPAVHVRAGDIVMGAWRQFTSGEKYTPTFMVEAVIEALANGGADRILVVSDNEGYLRLLRARFAAVQGPGEFIDGYDRLTETQRAFADILLLARASRIIGPSGSAFSQLGGALGGRSVENVTHGVGFEDASRSLSTLVARAQAIGSAAATPNPLLARDICWHLDIFSDEMPLSEARDLAVLATKIDPDFCGGLTRAALHGALTGEPRNARAWLDKAMALAEGSEIHDDPMVEAIAARIGVSALAIDADADAANTPPEMAKLLERCEQLHPFQVHLADVLRNLRAQCAMAAWKAILNPSPDGGGQALGRLPILARDSGVKSLASCEIYPQVLRNAERATITLSNQLRAALDRVPGRLIRPAMFAIDGMQISPSGLRWISGYAYEPEAAPEPGLIALETRAGIVAIGVTHIARPDIVAMTKDERSLMSGFTFPIPPEIADDAAALQSAVRILDNRNILARSIGRWRAARRMKRAS